MFENLIIPAVIVGIAAFVTGAILLGVRAERKRTAEFADLAQRIGMYFDAEAHELLARLPQFQLFSLGHNRRATRWLRGGKGADELWIFDYSYVTGGGKNQSRHHHTLAAFPRLEGRLPAFQLRPENIFHKIGSAFGYQDIDLPDHPEFSSKYLLRGGEEHAIRQLFTAARVSYIMQMPSICIEAEENSLIVYPPSGRVSPAEISELIDRARAVKQLFTDRSQGGLKSRLT